MFKAELPQGRKSSGCHISVVLAVVPDRRICLGAAEQKIWRKKIYAALSEEQRKGGEICAAERTTCPAGAILCSVVGSEMNDRLCCGAAGFVVTHNCTAVSCLAGTWGWQRGHRKEEKKAQWWKCLHVISDVHVVVDKTVDKLILLVAETVKSSESEKTQSCVSECLPLYSLAASDWTEALTSLHQNT